MTPEINDMIERTSDVIGGVWGNHISWLETETFDFENKDAFRAYGHKPVNRQPVVGAHIAAEFNRSWIVFEVTEIERPGNPADMFFITVKPVEQVSKPSNN